MEDQGTLAGVGDRPPARGIVTPLNLAASGRRLQRMTQYACDVLTGEAIHHPGEDSRLGYERSRAEEGTGVAVVDPPTGPQEFLARIETTLAQVSKVSGTEIQPTLDVLARVARFEETDRATLSHVVMLLDRVLGLWDRTPIPGAAPLLDLATILEAEVAAMNTGVALLERFDAALEGRGIGLVRDSRRAREALLSDDVVEAYAEHSALAAGGSTGTTDAVLWLRRQLVPEVARRLRQAGTADDPDELWSAWEQFALTDDDRGLLLPHLLSALTRRRSNTEQCFERLGGIAVAVLESGRPVDAGALDAFFRQTPAVDGRPVAAEAGAETPAESVDPGPPVSDLPEPAAATDEPAVRPLLGLELRLRDAALVGLRSHDVDVDGLLDALDSGSDAQLRTIVIELRTRLLADDAADASARSGASDSDEVPSGVGLLLDALGPTLRDVRERLQVAAKAGDVDEVRACAALLEGLQGSISEHDLGWIVTGLIRRADLEREAASEPLVEAVRLVIMRLREGSTVSRRTAGVLMTRWRKQLRRESREQRPGAASADLTYADLLLLHREYVDALLAAPDRKLRRMGKGVRLDPHLATSTDEDPVDLAEQISTEYGHLQASEAVWLTQQVCNGSPGSRTVLRTARLVQKSLEAGESIHSSVVVSLLAVISRILQSSGFGHEAVELERVQERIIEAMRAIDAQTGQYGDVLPRINLLGLQDQLKTASQRGDVEEMERIVDSLRRHGPLGPYETGWLVEGLCDNDELDRAIQVIESAAASPEAARGLTTYALMPVLRLLTSPPVPSMSAAVRLVESVEDATRTFEERRVVADAQVVQVLVTGYGRSREPERAEELLREWCAAREITIDERHYGALMQAWSVVGDTGRCAEILEEMRTAGVAPTERHLQSLAAAYARVGDLEGAGRVLHDVRDQFGRVSSTFVEIVAREFVHSHDLELTLRWADAVDALPDPPEHSIHEIVASNCGGEDVGRLEKATALLARQDLLDRPEIVDGLVLSAAAAASNVPVQDRTRVIRVIEELLERLHREGSPMPSLEPLARFAKYARSAVIARAVVAELDEQAAVAGAPEPSAAQIGPVLEVFSGFGDVAECERLWARFVDPTRYSAPDAVYLYNVLIAAHNRSINPSQARIEELFSEMRSNGLSPDTFTVAQVARAQDQLGAFDDESWMIADRGAAALSRIVSLLEGALRQLDPVFADIDGIVLRIDADMAAGALEPVREGLDALKEAVREVSRRTKEIDGFSQEDNEDLSIIVEDIRHELSQPVMRIQVTIGTATNYAQRATSVHDISANWGEVKRQIALANETLARYRDSVARADFGEDVAVQEVVDAALRSVRDEHVKDVDFRISLNRDRFRPELRVIGNRFLLTRTFWALFTNAVQALTEAGTENPSVRVHGVFEASHGRTAAKFGTVAVIVEDNGPGISEEIRDRLTERGVTTKPGRGLGLGLAMVQSVVKAHGGSLVVDLHRGQGAYFQIGLPAAPPNGRFVDDEWEEDRHSGTVVRRLPSGSAGFVQDDDPGRGGTKSVYYFSTSGNAPDVGTRVSFRIEQRANRKRGTVEPRAVDIRYLETAGAE